MRSQRYGAVLWCLRGFVTSCAVNIDLAVGQCAVYGGGKVVFTALNKSVVALAVYRGVVLRARVTGGGAC